MDPLVLATLIGVPANLLVGFGAYRKAKSADNAVNHRVSGTTVSEDIADIRQEVRAMHKDFVWFTREFRRHLKEDHSDREE